MPNTTVLQQNFRRVHTKIEQLCRAAGRPPPRLIVASKGRSVAAITALHAMGQRDFGENYLTELEQKAQQLQALNLNWIFIGVLQSNKIARIVRFCNEIQSLASLKHARYIDRYAAQFDKQPFPVYLAVNIGAEPQKTGFAVAGVESAAAQIVTHCPQLQLEGIMAVPPSTYCDRNWQQLPPPYRTLQQLASRCGNGKLSLGMSADLALALRAGSTCVRIGRDFFTPLPAGEK